MIVSVVFVSFNTFRCAVKTLLYSLLSIQNMMGGGKPTGGRHGSTKDTPSWTTIGLIFSFDHKGDPGEGRAQVDEESHNLK